MRLSATQYIGLSNVTPAQDRGRTFVRLIHYDFRRRYLSIASLARPPSMLPDSVPRNCAGPSA